MPAGNMSGLVRDHADDLARAVGSQQQAGVEEHVEPARDERVERAVDDQMDGDVGRVEARGPENWRGIDADDMFGFGVADEADALLLGGSGFDRRGQDDRRRK